MRWLSAASAALAVTLAAGCADDPGASPALLSEPTVPSEPTLPNEQTTSLPSRPPTLAVMRDAYDAGIAWAAANLEHTDPFTLVLYDYLGRRFGIAEFGRARQLAVAALPTLGETNERRLIDPQARVDPDAFDEPDPYIPSLVVTAALACDEPGVPPGFERWLRATVATGGYDLTHAAVALGIEADLGCAPTGGTTLRSEIVEALAAAVATDVETGAVDDVAIERVAMLCYLGAIDRVPDARMTAIIDAQRADGSWTTTEPNFEPHTTALAIWVLGGIIERDEGRSPPATPLVIHT